MDNEVLKMIFENTPKDTVQSPYEDVINQAAIKYSLPPRLLQEVVRQESQFKPNAKSGSNAMGLMQLTPITQKHLGVKNPNDPNENINAGARYLSQLMKKYNGDLQLTLAAYNAGPGNVAKYKNTVPPFPETQNYVNNILGAYLGL